MVVCLISPPPLPPPTPGGHKVSCAKSRGNDGRVEMAVLGVKTVGVTVMSHSRTPITISLTLTPTQSFLRQLFRFRFYNIVTNKHFGNDKRTKQVSRFFVFFLSTLKLTLLATGKRVQHLTSITSRRLLSNCPLARLLGDGGLGGLE